MPANTGQMPSAKTVDLMFRNGEVVRSTAPRKWRWTLGDGSFPALWAYDIVQYQEVK